MTTQQAITTAICAPGSTLSLTGIRAAALYFDRIYVCEAVPRPGEADEDVREIDSRLRELDKNYIIDVVKDNIPFFVTLCTTFEPTVALPIAAQEAASGK